MKFQGTLEKFDSELWYYHVKVPIEIVEEIKSKKIARLICSIDNLVDIECALMPAGNNQYFININKEVRKKLMWRLDESRSILLKADTSPYGMTMPEELQEVLASDPAGNDAFHSLTPGKQRNLIYIAAKPKLSATRLKKSIIMVDYLREVDGKLDFKELNQAFKDRKDDF